MPPEPDRWIAYWSAVAGGTFWALFNLTTLLMAGLPVSRALVARAFANAFIGIGCGGLVSYFMAPAVASVIPIQGLKDLHAVGFGIGCVAWELAPWAYKGVEKWAKAKAAKGAL